MTMKFKAEHTFDQRKAESERVRGKYPDRIPGKNSYFCSLGLIIN